MASPKPPTSNVSDAEITAFLNSNPGMSDAGIRQAMDQYGVNVGQMARATGMNYGEVQDRYNKAGSTTTPRPEPSTTTPRPERPDAPVFTPMDPTPYVEETRRSDPLPYVPEKRFPRPTKMFDMDEYVSMGKLAQMGYKKGGAVKAASGKSSANADKSGRLNLGSSRVSTAVKSKKNPNF